MEVIGVKHWGRSICNVSFSNLDLGNLVNGDPVELRPFDFHFRVECIIKTWIAVGFLPMTGNAAKDPKVRYELGDKGAPPEAVVHMTALHKENGQVAMALMEIGLNGNMFDLELPKVKADAIIANDDEKIKHSIDNHLITKAGGLYKKGLVWCAPMWNKNS
jgi:hypothetical protein